MALPDIEIVEEENFNNTRGKRIVSRMPVARYSRCVNCDQEIKRVRDSDGSLRMPPHNRKVFRSMTEGKPNWIIESCPGGKI